MPALLIRMSSRPNCVCKYAGSAAMSAQGAPIPLSPEGESVITNAEQIGLVLYSTDKFGDTLHRFSGFTLLVRLLKPESRGTVLVKSADPLEAPAIRPEE